jgi:hypothetical protein
MASAGFRKRKAASPEGRSSSAIRSATSMSTWPRYAPAKASSISLWPSTALRSSLSWSVERADMQAAARFLQALIAAVPYRIHTVLTDNGIQFADLPKNRKGPTARFRGHPFDRVCLLHGIDHLCLAKIPSGRKYGLCFSLKEARNERLLQGRRTKVSNARKGCSPGHDGVAITLWQFFMLSFLEISTKRRLRQPDCNDDAGRQASVSIQPCDLHRDISLPLDP